MSKQWNIDLLSYMASAKGFVGIQVGYLTSKWIKHRKPKVLFRLMCAALSSRVIKIGIVRVDVLGSKHRKYEVLLGLI